MGFDYPITRPYPWRFATLWIIIVSGLTFAFIVYANVAVVGMTAVTALSTAFQGEKTPSWVNRMNIKKTLRFNLGCDPTTLVAGGTYRTPNGAFTYTIRNFVDKSTREVFSSIGYNGSSLSDCGVQSMGVFVNFITVDALFEANINCTLAGNLEMIATAPSLVTLRADSSSSIMERFEQELTHKQTQSTYLAPAIARLLAALGTDFMNQFLPNIPTIDSTTVRTVYSGFEIYSDMKFFYHPGTWSFFGAVSQGAILPKVFNNLSMSVFENFASVFWSAVLVDLGVTSRPNILTNADLFRQVIHSDLPDIKGISLSWVNGTAANFILNNPTEFDLPFTNIQSTSFNARYMCRYLSWKTPVSLVVDVLVATVSFFMLFWAAFKIALQYFAVESSTQGNHCTCPNCEGKMVHESFNIPTLRKPYNPDYNSEYERVPYKE
ncbi:hypothetical protein FS749_004683 [Ceratobasidium sp. UAMH 11750]|nr:hypothetical protein FS749_004683 [Ceratobasidium sp. UAMH 11750]